ncbi:MAG: ATP-binding protein [Lachnospiraceae bacterium]|nr:ATP-binding protein [Lachnospiraceae bacterium]
MERKKIGIGYEDYREFIDGNMYYVDKTLLIRDLLKTGEKVTLFTRPRRFGKTLALSMLRTFFEKELDRDGNVIDKLPYFQGKKIMDCGEDILSGMGKYPVIKLSLKSAKQPDFRSAFLMLRGQIIGEYKRHQYLMNSEKLNETEKIRFDNICKGDVKWDERMAGFSSEKEESRAFGLELVQYGDSLRILSELLEKHFGSKTIIFIDEYDVPLENAWHRGFYDEMVDFFRSLFESALKTNDALEFAVVTGCLRISRESIFTGLNHLDVNSILSSNFGEYFGFTPMETEEMLRAYGLGEKVDEVREWYDGYLFGEVEVYNPWSVIKYVREHESDPHRFAEPYWANTSSNDIVRELVVNADEKVREELNQLILGENIEKRIHEDITYGDIYESEDNLWSFLFFTGYLRKVSERREGRDIYLTMRIPNEEVAGIYSNHMVSWFDGVIKKADRKRLYGAIACHDTDGIADYVSGLLEQSISTFDSQEGFYHGFLTSLLYGFPAYRVQTNREEGIGRPDIVLYPNRPKDPAYLFEVKACKKFNQMEDGLNKALDQIRDRKYEEGVLNDGYAGCVSFGICFCRKSCIAGLFKDNDGK